MKFANGTNDLLSQARHGERAVGQSVIEMIRLGLKADGLHVSPSKLCKRLQVPPRTAYYKPTEATPKIRSELGMNKNTVQRIFQRKGWRVRKRSEPSASGHEF